MKEEQNEMLTTKEAANLLRVSTRTITRLANKKKLPGAVKIGSQWRFQRNSIMSKVQECN